MAKCVAVSMETAAPSAAIMSFSGLAATGFVGRIVQNSVALLAAPLSSVAVTVHRGGAANVVAAGHGPGDQPGLRIDDKAARQVAGTIGQDVAKVGVGESGSGVERDGVALCVLLVGRSCSNDRRGVARIEREALRGAAAEPVGGGHGHGVGAIERPRPRRR